MYLPCRSPPLLHLGISAGKFSDLLPSNTTSLRNFFQSSTSVLPFDNSSSSAHSSVHCSSHSPAHAISHSVSPAAPIACADSMGARWHTSDCDVGTLSHDLASDFDDELSDDEFTVGNSGAPLFDGLSEITSLEKNNCVSVRNSVVSDLASVKLREMSCDDSIKNGLNKFLQNRTLVNVDDNVTATCQSLKNEPRTKLAAESCMMSRNESEMGGVSGMLRKGALQNDLTEDREKVAGKDSGRKLYRHCTASQSQNCLISKMFKNVLSSRISQIQEQNLECSSSALIGSSNNSVVQSSYSMEIDLPLNGDVSRSSDLEMLDSKKDERWFTKYNETESFFSRKKLEVNKGSLDSGLYLICVCT